MSINPIQFEPEQPVKSAPKEAKKSSKSSKSSSKTASKGSSRSGSKLGSHKTKTIEVAPEKPKSPKKQAVEEAKPKSPVKTVDKQETTG